jgi:hypothetical protein
MTIDNALLDKFSAAARDAKLDQAGAQKIASLWAEHVAASESAAVKAHQEQVAQWRQDAEKHPELGGANFKTNLVAANQALNRWASPPLIQLLRDSGLANHPELVAMFARIGKASAEDRPGAATPPPAEPTREQLLAEEYPTMHKPRRSS